MTLYYSITLCVIISIKNINLKFNLYKTMLQVLLLLIFSELVAGDLPVTFFLNAGNIPLGQLTLAPVYCGRHLSALF